MPGACQLSGNAVPAVGKGEGATPRRIPYLAITCLKLLCRIAKYMISLNAVPKIFILLSKFSPIFSIFVSALVRVSDGALPLLTSPHGNFSRAPCLTAPYVAPGTRGFTPVICCTLRRPRRNGIYKAD